MYVTIKLLFIVLLVCGKSRVLVVMSDLMGCSCVACILCKLAGPIDNYPELSSGRGEVLLIAAAGHAALQLQA